MPGIALHLSLADRILDTWADCPSAAPFTITDSEAIHAFRHGSIGPDLGYFPGGERVLSDLSHCYRSGQLTESLIDHARTPVERAFAWGWVTHVLADRIIHPLIATAVGEYLTGATACFVDGDRDPIHHMRIEVGLDVWVAALRARPVRPPLGPIFDPRTIRFLTAAYEGAYGRRFDRDSLLGSHRSAHRAAHVGSWIIGGMAPALFHERGAIHVRLARWLLHRAQSLADVEFGQESLALALFTPVAPSPRLAGAIVPAVEEVVNAFWDRYFSRSDRIGDFNLDNGMLERDAITHRGAARAEAFVRRNDQLSGATDSTSPPPVVRTLREPSFPSVPSRIGDPSATPR